MTQYFVEYNPIVECELNGKLESEAHKLECRVIPQIDPMQTKGDRIIAYCIASACAHWRWLHKGGTRYEKRTFESEMPMPGRDKAPADVPDGWAFIAWDSNMNGTTAKPRFWAKRAVEIVLPRGLCGLAGGEEV